MYACSFARGARDTAESGCAKTPRQGFADHAPGEYQSTVETARAAFARGDLFEAVPGQLFAEACERTPAEVFQRLCVINPSPYGALMNLGDGEFLVSASPEMFVRSDGRRVETCPISGTIARGVDAIGDAEQIRQLLNSEKDEFELNMCTDVDRNDKARVCVPGTIKVLARRQIETYSKLFHTVDHVEGILKPGFDSHNILTMQMSLTGPRFEKTLGVAQMTYDGIRRVSALPGVEAVAATCCVPLQGGYDLPFIVARSVMAPRSTGNEALRRFQHRDGGQHPQRTHPRPQTIFSSEVS